MFVGLLSPKKLTINISNIKNYMLKWLTVPLDEVSQPERLIIMRSGRPERQ